MTKVDIAMTHAELKAYLAGQRTIRVATVGPDDEPHVVPLWFVWLDQTVFLNSTLGNPTVENMLRTGRASGVIDDGELYDELRGVEVRGRVARAHEDPRVPDADRLWSDKYMGGNPTPYGRWRNRTWITLTPDRIASWDFRKIPEARARARKET